MSQRDVELVKEAIEAFNARDLETLESGTARLSGVPFDMKLGMTYEVRDAELWRMRGYSDPDEALAAAGIAA